MTSATNVSHVRMPAVISLAALLFFGAGPIAHATPRRIACLGDSITNQYGPTFGTAAGESCTVVAQDGGRTDQVLELFRSRVRGHEFTDLIVRAGRNDVYAGRGVAAAERNLQTIYDEARADGMRVVAVSMLPHKGYVNYDADKQRQTDELNGWVASNADQFVNADSYMADASDPLMLKAEYARSDHLHLSDTGKRTLAAFIAQSAFGGSGTAAPTSAGGTGAESTNTPFVPLMPELEIFIPTLPSFSNIQVLDENGNRSLDIPFLAEYIVAIYRYALGIIVTLAMVMVVVGGLRWMTAAGNTSTIGAAKDTIIRALMGLVIAFGSYAILFLINPELVNFRNVRIDLIRRQEVINEENGGIENGGCAENCGTRRSISDPTFDEIFQRYAGCAGVDWRVLKAVASIESGLNPTVVNRYGYVGLFQVGPRSCAGGAEYCTTEALQDPQVNTYAAATGQLRNGARTLRNSCPNMTDAHRYTMLLYFGHNSGNGALQGVLNGREGVMAGVGCDATDEQYRQAGADFWENYSRVQGRSPPPNAAGRMDVASRVADTAVSLGVTDPTAAGTCGARPPLPTSGAAGS